MLTSMQLCDFKPSHEGESFKAEEHNDVVLSFFFPSLPPLRTPTPSTAAPPLQPGPVPGCE